MACAGCGRLWSLRFVQAAGNAIAFVKKTACYSAKSARMA